MGTICFGIDGGTCVWNGTSADTQCFYFCTRHGAASFPKGEPRSSTHCALAPRTTVCNEQVILPFQLLLTLVPICAGVALSTANDTEVSMEGAFWAIAGLLSAAGYQVLVKSTQQNLKVGSTLRWPGKLVQVSLFIAIPIINARSLKFS